MFRILWKALQLWWRDWIGILFLNMGWFLLQIFIVTGPPATAVFYAITQKMHDEEVWDFSDVRELFVSLFWDAWKWALPTYLMVLVVAGNFYAYRGFIGGFWTTVRIFWGVLAFVLFVMILFYWPFWFQQEDKSVRTTFANIFRFLLKNPAPVLGLTAVCGLVVTLSLRIVFPITIGVMGWVFLVGNTAVAQALKAQN